MTLFPVPGPPNPGAVVPRLPAVGREQALGEGAGPGGGEESAGGGPSEAASAPASAQELTESQRRELARLARTDLQVRAHERAHLARAGPLARGGAAFEFRTGPDGRRYAVGGEVEIDVSPVPGDPQATIEKAGIVRSAALAPRDPSAQDRSVAARASRMEAEARQDLRAAGEEQASGAPPAGGDEDGDGPAAAPPVGAIIDVVT